MPFDGKTSRLEQIDILMELCRHNVDSNQGDFATCLWSEARKFPAFAHLPGEWIKSWPDAAGLLPEFDPLELAVIFGAVRNKRQKFCALQAMRAKHVG